jgi:Na+/H+-dicarboxylate symporter
MKSSRAVLVALIVALIAGAAIARSGNPALLSAADLFTPVGTLWINAIRMTVIPLVVSLLITGVASASNLQTIGRMGGRTLLIFALMLTGLALLVLPVAQLTLGILPPSLARPPLPAGAAEAAGQLGSAGSAASVQAWVMSLIPSNPIAAAANGQMVPLILFTLLLALAITRIPAASRERLVGLFQSLLDAMLVLVHWVIALAPIGVFALMLPLTAHGGGAVAGAVGIYTVVYSLATIAGVLLLYPVAAVIGRVPVRQFARAVLPAQLIAFSSSSSIASLPAVVEGAEDGLGLPSRVVGFVVPVAISLFKYASALSWPMGAIFVAWFYGIPLHFKDLLTIEFAAVFLAFAAPGVPRGAFLMLTPLFLAIGLPAEGIGILIAIDTIPDLFATVLNVTGDMVATILVARTESEVTRD